MLESLFNKVAGLHVCYCEYYKSFKNICFEERLTPTVSDFKQRWRLDLVFLLLALNTHLPDVLFFVYKKSQH